MRFSSDPFATYRLLKPELSARGYTVTERYRDGHLIVSFVSPLGRAWETAAAHITYPFTSDAMRLLSIDKSAAYQFVSSFGVPTPFTQSVAASQSVDEAELDSLLRRYAPLVVKPNDSSLSKGLTLAINSRIKLATAIGVARAVNRKNILIQQQVFGDEVRFVFVRGKIIAALLRQTPRVVGDGRHAIEQLLEKENIARRALSFPYITYPQLDERIINEHFLRSAVVPGDGEIIEFSRATMIKRGCSVYEVLDEIHPSYLTAFEVLAAGVESDFFVADFLLGDYRHEMRSDNHWFLEFNVSPVLKLFYGCRDGKMFDIIPIIADLIDDN